MPTPVTVTGTAALSEPFHRIETGNSPMRAACRDIADSIKARDLWIFLGWRDVKKHYQRSIIGPFWVTLSMGIMVGSLGILYSQIFGMDIRTYLPFLAVGLILWGFIGGSINAACTVFSGASSSIRQVRLPVSIYVFQFVWSQLITLGHNFLIYIVVALVFGIDLNASVLLFLPALMLLSLNAAFCAMIFGPLCARFRDIPMIVSSVIQVTFFLTPILWSVRQIPDRAIFVNLNPFYHFIEIARDPLLGQTGNLANWLTCIGITIVLGLVAIFFFARYRARIAYWA